MGKPARLFTLLALSLSLCSAAEAVAGPVRGSVVDATGASLPRALVRLLDETGRERSSTSSDSGGRFTVTVDKCDACSVETSLTGFKPSRVKLNDQTSLTIVLELAPIADLVTVTATREAAPAGQVGASVTVFTADDIARRGTTLVSDLVREAPGVAVIQTGGRGGQTSLFLRGGESTYTKVLLDGIPLNEPGGTFNFAGLTTTNLSRVEVVRGAQSALFGSDAMSGVIQLVTARGVSGARPTFTGSAESGGYATRRANGTLSGAARGWDFSVGVAATATDNRAPNSRLEDSTLSWSAGGAFTNALTVRAVGRLETGRVGTPGQTAFGRADRDAFFDHRDGVAGVSLEQRISANWRQRLSYGFTRTRQDSTNLKEDAPYVPSYGTSTAPFTFFDFTYDTHNVLRRQFASYQADGRINASGRFAQLVTIAADWDGERATLTDRAASNVVRAERNNIGVSVQHQFTGRRGSLASSLRAEHNDSFGDKWVPRVSGALVLHPSTNGWGELTLKANAGRGVKEPTILQSFSPNAYYLGNPDLLPEIATTWDLGVSQRLAGDRARIDAVYFDNRYENLISTRTTNFTTFAAQYFNIGNTTARGLELSGDAAIIPALRVTGGYTYTDSKIVKSTSDFSTVLKAGNSAFRRPRHAVFLRAAVTTKRVNADVDGQYVGKRADSDFSSLSPEIRSSGEYWLWNLSLAVKLTPRFELYGRALNLGDADYMEPLGYPAWRRTAHGGVRVRF
ncbi:MAG: TonB-dependent receptor [Acidobacteria bacterium]|nr:MAG: TonB-dependent receptor [Acidobacteriota bacterium]